MSLPALKREMALKGILRVDENNEVVNKDPEFELLLERERLIKIKDCIIEARWIARSVGLDELHEPLTKCFLAVARKIEPLRK